ncbi:MAG TPA: hypothetical protein VN446_06405 [Candidatus Acidoferrum sp.]|nr:hypothetical protein [Candidatus Acidoferrum sp.]
MLVTAVALLLLLTLINPNRSPGGCVLWAAARAFDLIVAVVLLWLLFRAVW